MANMKKIVVAGVVVLALVLGGLGYAFFRPPEQASAPIEAISLASSAASASGSPTTGASASPSTAATSATAAASSAASAEGTTDTATAAATTASADAVVLQIVQEESEARFVIDEVLNNEPVTVVGTTNQVAGEIAVDAQNPSATQVGIIQVNARTLATDNEFRNRAIKNRILLTDQYEFITFTPKQIIGLAQTGTVGQTYTFQIVGALTIRDTTEEVTFDVTVTPTTDTRLEGTAQTTIRYADYNITIPQVPQVASVSDEVRLEIDFVATTA